MNRSNATARRLRLIALLVMALAVTFTLARQIGRRATFREGTITRPADFIQPVGTDTQGQPIYSYAAVDPALIPALEAAGGFDAPDPFAVIAPNVPPIGVYLPATGDTQFQLPPPTPTPAVSPLPTVSPFMEPTAEPPMGIITLTPRPTVRPVPTSPPAPGNPLTPIPDNPPAPEPYDGDDCAPSGWPVAGRLTQYFAWYHRGIDLGTPLNTPVLATHSGTIRFAGWRTDGYGNLIILENGMFITYYGHLTDFNVGEGQQVGRGSVIGWSGSTGNSSGPHVHYETRINDSEVDPLTFESRGYPSC
jgi:murein DD-endopeptidase MepM/ murein hydrolase activator NlpD